jgi:hypothetical protein
VPKDAPWAPPIVSLGDGAVGHLLAWELVEVTGTWQAWVSWVQQTGGRPVHKIVSVGAAGLWPLEEPEVYSKGPRRVRGRDGVIPSLVRRGRVRGWQVSA